MKGSEYYHAHEIDLDLCDGRMRCMRICPTHAIRVRDGKARIIGELCVDCGECIAVCPHNAVVPLTDSLDDSFFGRKCRIAIPSPVLYSQFGADTPPWLVHKALKAIGFDYIFDVAQACNWAVLATELFLREHEGPWPIISTFCPAVVRLIQVKYPDLTRHILPIELPRELTAREAKKGLAARLDIKEPDIEAVYITSCPAKIVSIRQPAEKKSSWLDSAVGISGIYRALLSQTSELRDDECGTELFEDAAYGPGWSSMGGMTSLLGTEKWIGVSGMNDVTTVLDDIENSRLRNVEFVEASACLGGCIGGSLAVENIYVARSRTIRLTEKYGRNIARHVERVEKSYRRGFFDIENPVEPRPLSPLDPDIGRAIAKIKQRDEIYEALPKIDCGACGAPSCLTFAEDVIKGEAEMSMCVLSPDS